MFNEVGRRLGAGAVVDRQLHVAEVARQAGDERHVEGVAGIVVVVPLRVRGAARQDEQGQPDRAGATPGFSQTIHRSSQLPSPLYARTLDPAGWPSIA